MVLKTISEYGVFLGIEVIDENGESVDHMVEDRFFPTLEEAEKAANKYRRLIDTDVYTWGSDTGYLRSVECDTEPRRNQYYFEE